MSVRNKMVWIGSSMIMLMVFIRANGGGVADYIHSVKSSTAVTVEAAIAAPAASPERAQLREQIEEQAKQYYIAPVDARIDRVWKAIPGYNGLEVDVERSLEKTLAAGTSAPIQYVFREVPPQIGLQDLGPLPTYKGNPEKKMIALMVNVAWGNEFIPSILDTLEKEQVKATFFLDGSWLNKNAEVAKQIQEKGHEMSNHAYSHPNMSELDRASASSQISRTEELLKSSLNVDNKWFAPPSGDFNAMTVQVAAEHGLRTVLWTIDTVDWMKPPADSIIRKISSKLEPGALILMHPTASSRDALLGMIREAKRQGYALGTVSETLSSSRLPSAVETMP